MRRNSAAALCLMGAMLVAVPALADGAPSSSPPVVSTSRSIQAPASNGSDTQVTPRGTSPVAPRPASSADRMSYAAREAATPDAKNYKGGDAVVVIGASTATVILAVVLLIVLL